MLASAGGRKRGLPNPTGLYFIRAGERHEIEPNWLLRSARCAEHRDERLGVWLAQSEPLVEQVLEHAIPSGERRTLSRERQY
ncbi:hypothetical protein PDO_4842 [Rhizobium sp. PDO1-076]|nr:hypothetical protein PDO_4842 [Rhizobium sp. PDO1-076]